MKGPKPPAGFEEDELPTCLPFSPFESPEAPWFFAMSEAECGDTGPLRKMLRDRKSEMTPRVWLALDDLLERCLSRPRGGRRTPIYHFSKTQTVLISAIDDVLFLRQNGTPRKKAIKEVAHDHGIDPDTLTDVCNGKHASLRRKLKELARLGRADGF
jgi:hypothetical protein